MRSFGISQVFIPSWKLYDIFRTKKDDRENNRLKTGPVLKDYPEIKRYRERPLYMYDSFKLDHTLGTSQLYIRHMYMYAHLGFCYFKQKIELNAKYMCMRNTISFPISLDKKGTLDISLPAFNFESSKRTHRSKMVTIRPVRGFLCRRPNSIIWQLRERIHIRTYVRISNPLFKNTESSLTFTRYIVATNKLKIFLAY